MSDSNEEQRRYPRHFISGIKGTLHSPGDVRVIDISLTGLSLESTSEMEVGESYFLELQHEKKILNAEVRVRWCSVRRVTREGGDLRPVFRAGARFVDVYRDDTGGIWDWILAERELAELAEPADEGQRKEASDP